MGREKNNKTIISIIKQKSFILLGMGLGAFFWILESALHAFIFHEGNLINQILPSSPHELWMRLVITFLFIMFGFYAQYIINKRKRAEERAEHISHNLDQIFNTSADGMWLVDKNHTIILINNTLANLSGINKDDAVGKKCYEIFHGPLCQTNSCPLVRIFNGEERIECDEEKKRNDGLKIPCLLTATSFRSPKGELIGIVEDFKDITERKRAENALRLERDNLINILNSMEDGVYIVDQEYNIQYINPHLKKQFGPVKEKKCYEYFHDRREACPWCKNLDILAGKTVRWEWYSSKGKKTYDLIDTPLRNPDGTISKLEIFRDITEIKKKEEELEKYKYHLENLVKERTAQVTAVNEHLQQEIIERQKAEETIKESEEKFRSIFENVNDGILLADPVNKKYYSANKRFCQMLGYSLEEIKNLGVSDLHPEEALSYVIEQFEKQVEGQIKLAKDILVKRKTGESFYADINSTLITFAGEKYLVGIFRDITERKQAEEAIRLAYAELTQIFDIIDSGMCVIDKEFNVLRINETLAVLLDINKDKDKVVGKKCREVFPEYICHSINCPLTSIVNGEKRTEVYLELQDRNGAKIPCLLTTTAFHDPDGELIGIVINFKDITEHKKREEEMKKIQKLESLGILAGGIAHDFNNLLTSIMGNLSMAEIFAKSGGDVFEILKGAKKASKQAKKLTQQLLTFSKGGEPIKKLTSILELLINTTSFALSGTKAKCAFFLPDDLWWVEIDEGQIDQVINNLIINADQAMPEGGVVEVGAENVTVNKQDRLPLEEGKYIKISITDQGIGVPEEYLQKIFDPYFTTKQKGSGLGLAITYSIIKKHEGYITLKSGKGVGTTFFIYLPAIEKQIFAMEEVVEEIIDSGKGKILFMDDQQNVRDTVGEMLNYIGYEVEFANDGKEAIELYKKAKESKKPFDAVILDLTVPAGMGGKEAIQRLIEIELDVKAIVSSGYSNDPVLSEYKQYGFSGVVTKPYDIEELSETLHKVIISGHVLKK